jgi:cell division FtsZ-interacting protein ZapD
MECFLVERIERTAILSQALAYVRAFRACHDVLDGGEAAHLRDKALRTLQSLEQSFSSAYDWSNQIPTDTVPALPVSPHELGHYWLSEL